MLWGGNLPFPLPAVSEGVHRIRQATGRLSPGDLGMDDTHDLGDTAMAAVKGAGDAAAESTAQVS